MRWRRARGDVVEAARQTITQLPAVAASIATRRYAPAMVSMGAEVFPREYAAGRAEGLEPIDALVRATGQTGAELGPEAMALNVVLKTPIGNLLAAARRDPKALTDVAKFFGKVSGAEMGSEELSTVLGHLVDKGMADPRATPDQLLADVQQTFRQMLVQGPMLAGGAAAVKAVPQAVSAARTFATQPVVEEPAPVEPPAPVETNPVASGLIPAADPMGRFEPTLEPVDVPAAVQREPWDEPTASEPLTIAAPEVREMLEHLAKNEAGWAEIGGRMIRTPVPNRSLAGGGTNETISRTQWIPRSDWWRGRPDPLSEDQVRDAVRKAIAGEPLKAAERRMVGYLVNVANDRIADRRAIGDQEWSITEKDVSAEGLEPTHPNVVDSDLVARAVAINEAAVETAAIQYEHDDAAFMAEIRRIANGQKVENAEAARGREANRGASQEGARPGLELETHTEKDLAARERTAREAAARRKAEEEAAEAKRKADAGRGDFILTGSGRSADANPDQGDIFSGNLGMSAAGALPKRASEFLDAEELPATAIAMTPPYTGVAGEVVSPKGARPDAIRQTIRDLFRVPINEGGFKHSRDALGFYKVKPQTIRVRNENDIGVISHELGHHISETSRPIREARKAFDAELRSITPYAAKQKSTSLQREEGMAEFVRLYLTEREQAKAKARGFFKAFDAYMEQHGMKKAIDRIGGAIRDWQNLPPADRILAKVGEAEPEFRKQWNVDRILFEVFDRWLPMKRMVEDLKPDIAPSKDPFKLAHLLAGDAALIEDWLLRETTPFNFERRANVKDRGKPLAEILKPIEGKQQQRQFGAYLIAKRADELQRRGKEHLYQPSEIKAGLSLETPQFKAAAEELYRYQDQLLDYAVEGGLLSQRAADAFRRFPFYVPFFRVGEPIARQGGNIFKEIRGGTENLRDPVANIIENTVRVIHATNRNAVLAKAHDLARSVPGGGRWLEGVPMPERAVKVETQKVIETLRSQGVEISQEAAEALATSQTFFVKNPFGDDRQRIVIVRQQGRPHALQVNNDMLWRALERFEPLDLGFVEKLLSVPADLLRAGIVLSPDFMAGNVSRDTLSGFIQSKAGILPVLGTLEGFKEIAVRSDAARLYRAFGGAYGDMWRADSGLERKLVERMARHGGFDPRTIVTPRGLISLLHRIGSVSEAGTRVAEFKKSIGKGTTDELIDAAYNAREVSVDFGMHGHSRSVRFITRITPFLNPALQGWYKAFRTGGSAPLATIVRGGMLTAASLWLFFENRDEEWYQRLERWERNTFWHLDVGLRDKIGQVIPLRFKKPFEWGAVFGSVPEALAEVAIEQNGPEFGKRLASIVDDVMIPRVIPTAVLVPAELWANKNQFTGRPIVPESKLRLAPELQSTPWTSLTAQKLGGLTGTPPAKIDHAVRGFTGTLGTYTLMLADQAMRLDGEGRAAKLPIQWQQAPVARVFFHDPSGASSRHVSEFYELLREARRAEASLKRMDQDQMADYYRKHQAAIESRRSAEKVSRWMADLRKENEQLRNDKGVPPEERQRMILENNQQIRFLARDFMREIKPAARPAPQ